MWLPRRWFMCKPADDLCVSPQMICVIARRWFMWYPAQHGLIYQLILTYICSLPVWVSFIRIYNFIHYPKGLFMVFRTMGLFMPHRWLSDCHKVICVIVPKWFVWLSQSDLCECPKVICVIVPKWFVWLPHKTYTLISHRITLYTSVNKINQHLIK